VGGRLFAPRPTHIFYMSFRIVSYNIFKGGKNGFEQLAQSVCDLEADCIGLLEANGWGEENEKLLKSFSEITKYPFYYHAKANTNYDIVCLNKIKPKISTHITNGFWHAVLINVVETVEIGKVAIIFLHLNPKTEVERIKEIAELLVILKQYPSAIILGDFNSLSVHDPYNKTELLMALQTSHITKFGSDYLCFDTIKAIESAGYIDCAVEQKYFITTVPTTSNDDPMHAIPLRIDYAFVSPNLISYVKNISIKKGEMFNKASDHYPLVLDMSLTIL